MTVPKGRTLYSRKKVFKAGETIPSYLEKNAKNLFEKSNKPQEKQEKKFDFKKEDK